MKTNAFLMLAACLMITVNAWAQAPSSLWTKTFDGPAHRGDIANGCAVDRSGNLYATGYSQHRYSGGDLLTIKYNAATGDTIWTSRYSVWTGAPSDTSHDLSGNACAVDRSGNLYAAGWSFGPRGYNLLLVRYNTANGTRLWSKTYGANNNEWAMGCATDMSGAVYTSGTTDQNGTEDFLVMKYTPNGDTVWSRTYDGPAHGSDEGLGCAVDNSGNLYVGGYSHTGTSYAILLVKYNSNGDTIWTRRSADVLDSIAHPSVGCAVDSTGNVYVTGMCGIQLNYGERYSVTMKYSSSGSLLWTRKYDSPSNYDQTISCAVDSKNDLYVSGTTYNTVNDDWLIIKYNSANGDPLWTIRQDGIGGGSDYATSCTLDGSDNLYVAGLINWFDSDTTSDYQVTKYRSTVTSIDMRPDGMPGEFALYQNYPNPFNPTTRITYSLPADAFVSMKVFDALGRVVKYLVDDRQSAGTHSISMDANSLPSGVYFYTLRAGINSETKKLVLLK